MDDMNEQQPFERQVANVTQRAVGPERHVEALAIARHARAQGRRNRFAPLAGALQFATGAAVVAVFGALLIFSGVLDSDDDAASIGASPSPTVLPDESATAPTTRIVSAGGRFQERGIWWPSVEGLGEADPLALETPIDAGENHETPWPRLFTVVSTDERLSGEAMMRVVAGRWEHEFTVDDLDAGFSPARPPTLESAVGRLEIRNQAGSWEGTVGPSFYAEGAWVTTTTGEPELRQEPTLPGRVPAVLQGRGAYAGLTAYLTIGADDDRELFIAGPVYDGAFTDFEAVIVSAGPLPPLAAQDWAEAREWWEIARDAGVLD